MSRRSDFLDTLHRIRENFDEYASFQQPTRLSRRDGTSSTLSNDHRNTADSPLGSSPAMVIVNLALVETPDHQISTLAEKLSLFGKSMKE
jgi:hypothetical protein